MSILEKIFIVCMTLLFVFIIATQTQPNFRADGNDRYNTPTIAGGVSENR